MGVNYYTDKFDSTAVIVTITSALSLYNALELLLLIFSTFTHYTGLYFWSLLVATSGLVPYSIGVIILYFRLTKSVAGLVINNYGWWTTITGQSVVLYSRLGIVLGNGHQHILKYVKWMIIVDAVLLHGTTTVVVFGSYYASPPAKEPFSRAYTYVEKIQMTVFCIQEFIISGLYLWKTLDIVKTQARPLRASSDASEKRNTTRVSRVMMQLFIINIVIVAMDIALLVIEYKDLHIPEVAFKGLCYSVKLKLEFAVLSKLVEVAGTKRNFSLGANTFNTTTDDNSGGLHDDKGSPDLVVDATQQTANSNAMHSFGSESTSPPEWLEDLEKVRSRPAAKPQPTPNTDVDKLQEEKWFDERKLSNVSTFNNISVSEPPVHRRMRRDSDLLYADAIRELSK